MLPPQGPHFENHWVKPGTSVMCMELSITAMPKPDGLRGLAPQVYAEETNVFRYIKRGSETETGRGKDASSAFTIDFWVWLSAR